MKNELFFVLVLVMLITSCIPLTVSADTNAAPTVIPAIREWQGSTGSFSPNASTALVDLSSSKSVEKVKGYFSQMLNLDLDVKTSASGANETSSTVCFCE